MKMDISLLITNYNRSQFIERAIRSCQNQLILNTMIEIIVVDDCSTDDSLERIDQFKKDLIIIKHKQNKGIGAASATGLAAANGKYFMRVDSDDYLSRSSCIIHKSILDNNQHFSFSYSDIIELDKNGRVIKNISLTEKKQLYKHGAGIMFNTEIVKNVGGYDKNFKNAEDYDLLLRLEKNKKIGYHTPIPLYRYYKHVTNLSKNHDRKEYWKLAQKKNNV